MTLTWRCWKLGLASLLGMGGAIAFLGDCALAQISPDTTLGNESSQVTSTGAVDTINGGATRGANLFHSFQEFNVNEGRAAFFTNPAGIENILSRVTGGNLSNILGTLGVSGGNANLFLINPRGIIFGPNARLDVGGSFVGTTANAIEFGNQGFFSASNPESSSSLLTVNPSALLFNQIKTASIQNNSVADSGLNPSSEFTATGLRVPDGKSLLLVGGDINMDGGGLFAFGGRVELGGLAGAGTVGLNGDGNNLSLSFPESVERSNVSLSNGAGVAVIAGDGGSIAVNARNLEMTGESGLLAGIVSGLGSDNSKAGNIDINAIGAINLNNRSSIANQILAEANGQGGDVSISASTLQVEGGAQVSAATSGSGQGGNLRVDAQDVQLIGTSANGQVVSGLFASAQRNSTGDAGDLTIKTNTLLVKDGAQASVSTRGLGQGGNLTVDAQDMQLIGTSNDGRFPSVLSASAQQNSTGDAGDLTIKTNTLLVKDGAQVLTSAFGSGKGGSLTVDAQDILLIGRSADGQTSSGLFARTQQNSTGDAGDLTIKTNTLLVKDGAQASVSTRGSGQGGNLTVDAQDMQLIGTSNDGRFPSGLFASAQQNSTGDAGDLTIKTNTLLVKDGAQVGAGTFGSGKGGNLRVDAQDMQLIGISNDGQTFSVLSASAEPNSTGDAGDLTIKTNTLLVKDGAQILTSTFSEGKGGNLTVDAQDVQLIDTGNDGPSPTALNTSAQRNSTGDAGDLTIKTNTFLVKDGAQVSVSTGGEGKGGNLTVDAQDMQLIGTSNDGQASSVLGASAEPNSTGDAGDLTIKTNTLLVKDGSQLLVLSFGTGTAGNMELNAHSIRLDNNALLSGDTQSAKIDPNSEQATININSPFLIMSRNSNILTNGTGNNVIGGNINIDTDFLIAFENSDISANSTNFRGGRVKVNASGIFGTQFRDARTPESDITATGASPEFSGTVDINTPDVDPSRGLATLPAELVNVTRLIAQGCPGSGGDVGRASEFIITGRGGLPPNPSEALRSDAVRVNLATPIQGQENRASSAVSTNSTRVSAPTPIVEAQGWAIGANGEVILTARPPTVTPHSPWLDAADCHTTQNSS